MYSIKLTRSKPPKLRFRPGQFVELEGKLYEIIYAYRVKGDHQWRFCLEERRSFRSVEKGDVVGQWLADLDLDAGISRIVYDFFH